jgi:hypothetical protein
MISTLLKQGLVALVVMVLYIHFPSPDTTELRVAASFLDTKA